MSRAGTTSQYNMSCRLKSSAQTTEGTQSYICELRNDEDSNGFDNSILFSPILVIQNKSNLVVKTSCA